MRGREFQKKKNVGAKIPEEEKADMYRTEAAFRSTSIKKCRCGAGTTGLGMWGKRTLHLYHTPHTKSIRVKTLKTNV